MKILATVIYANCDNKVRFIKGLQDAFGLKLKQAGEIAHTVCPSATPFFLLDDEELKFIINGTQYAHWALKTHQDWYYHTIKDIEFDIIEGDIRPPFDISYL